ncbi:hypothetical protein Snas_3060 [Stackebrandtia nassauensis DSM 44728]|uniref:DUF2690 domain-containing protein n=2 Tax=Stackebrandtia TaxID=283810 RepID=D3QAE8_STANL|nr:hypothetical protein Snas_3060 [Stackebrandtia nassauensis DSM 44728]
MNTPSTNPHTHRMSRAVRFGIAAAVTILFVTLALTKPAQAADLRDWDGVNPQGTTCNNDAATVASADIEYKGNRLGTVELRYSHFCHTAWARLHNDMEHVPGDAHVGFADVVRDSDGLTYSCASPPGENTSCWTKMVDDAGGTVHAYGNIDPFPTFGHGNADAITESY